MSTDQPERSDAVAQVSARRIPRPDEAAHLDGRLMHELSKVNYQLSRYVLRFVDADASRATPIPVAEELALASLLATAAEAIRARAERRRQGAADDGGAEGNSR